MVEADSEDEAESLVYDMFMRYPVANTCYDDIEIKYVE